MRDHRRENFRDITPLFDQDYPSDRHFKVDLSLSENPLGCSPQVLDAVRSGSVAGLIQHYPDRSHSSLKNALAAFLKQPQDNLYIADGASGTLQDIVKIFISPGKNIVMPDSTFPAPAFGATALGGYARTVPLREDFRIDFDALAQACDNNTGLIFLCNPNNPTGILEKNEDILALARATGKPVVVSEAGMEFCAAGSLLDIAGRPENLIVVRSFSKAYGLAGLRVGYAVCSRAIREKLEKYNHIFKVSAVSAYLAAKALEDQDHVKRSVEFVGDQRDFLMTELENLDFQTLPSQSNVFIARLPAQLDSGNFLRDLGNHDCAVVSCSGFASLGPSFIRISPRTDETNREFIRIVRSVIT